MAARWINVNRASSDRKSLSVIEALWMYGLKYLSPMYGMIVTPCCVSVAGYNAKV
jgi:hypothetical protein